MNNNNSFLIELDGLELIQEDWWHLGAQHRWASPSIPSLRQLMRTVYENEHDVAGARARQARRDIIDRFSMDVVGRQIDARLQQILARLTTTTLLLPEPAAADAEAPARARPTRRMRQQRARTSTT